MAGITHTKVATLPDQPGVEVNKTEWNAAHSIASGTITEAMQVLADNTTQDFSTAKHGYVPKGTNVGSFLKDDGTWASPSAASTLNGITAATGAVTIASGNNTGIVWNWANTTNTTVAFTLGETTAATNGTSTSGVPNQVLFKLNTLAASTQSPLSVYSRGTHVFSVSPTVAQILAADGVVANPAYSFAGAVGDGMYWDNTPRINVAIGGVRVMSVSATQVLGVAGSSTTPTFANTTQTNTGLWQTGTVIGITFAGVENSQFSSGIFQPSKGSADAVSYAVNFRKARGTVASPTVITTGDDLATIQGYGYVGGTNTYQIGAKIRFTSSGTVSDAANGFAKSLEIWTGTATIASAVSWSVEPDGFTRYWKGTVANGVNAVTPPTTLGPVALAVQEWIQVYNPAGTLRYMPLYG